MTNKYVPLACFVAFVLKSLIFGANGIDGALIGVLGALAFFYEYTDFQTSKKEIKLELETVKQRLEILTQENANHKNYLASLKMSGARTFGSGSVK